ncbi:MAG: efflux RND transporter periplasmic adaptor subunit [Gammaproteobacteria bacterium]|nr:efflux RND transporter periplasmic adaptor subunit [Gammaproteobacteria bacterium]
MKYMFYIFLLVMPASVLANDAVAFSTEEMANIGIELGQPKLVHHSLTKSLPAEVSIPNRSQQIISAPQDGVIERLLVAEGDNVIAGQALAEMNSPQLLTRQSDYLQALSRLSQTKQEMLRDKRLFEEGIIAERRYRQIESRHQQQSTEVAMYRKSLQLAGMNSEVIAQLERQRSLNSHLTLNASENGVIMKQFVVAGQRLTAADPIYQIAQLSSLWLEIHVPLEIVNTINVNDPIQVCQKQIEGQVIAIGRQVHAADQGVLVRAEITKNTEQLTPGEFVQACFIQQSDKIQFELPRSAIFREQGQTRVFVKTDSGFISQAINVINDQGDHVIVSGDLSIQQQIVIKGTATVKAAWLGMGGE